MKNSTRQTSSTYRRVLGVVGLVSMAVVGAAVGVVASRCLTFGLTASAMAGDFPTTEVSRQVERLIMFQDYGNAAITGAALSMVLALGARLLRFLASQEVAGGPYTMLWHLIALTVAEGMLFTLVCLAFRSQLMGSQDLLLTAALHGTLWAGLGMAVLTPHCLRSVSVREIPLPVVVGFLWGIVLPSTVAVVSPVAYIERLFATPPLVAIWAGGGCLSLLSSVWAGRQCQRSKTKDVP